MSETPEFVYRVVGRLIPIAARATIGLAVSAAFTLTALLDGLRPTVEPLTARFVSLYPTNRLNWTFALMWPALFTWWLRERRFNDPEVKNISKLLDAIEQAMLKARVPQVQQRLVWRRIVERLAAEVQPSTRTGTAASIRDVVRNLAPEADKRLL